MLTPLSITRLFGSLGSLLLGDHDLEAVEVGKSGALLLGSELLGPGGGLPLAHNTLA